MNIIVDCDDVIIDLLSTWVKKLNKLYGTNVNKEDIKDWGLGKYFNLSEEQLVAPLLDASLWDEVKPIKGAVKALESISKTNNVFIATATDYRNFEAKIEKALTKYFPFIPVNNIVKCDNKSLLKADIIIDDNLNNLMGDSNLKILFTRAHNECFTYKELREKNIIRCNNWSEIQTIVEIIEEQKERKDNG